MQIRLLKRIGLGKGRIGEAGSVHVMTDLQAMTLVNRGVAVRFTPVDIPPERTTELEPTNTTAAKPVARAPSGGGRKRR